MRSLFLLFGILVVASSCSTKPADQARIIEDFNYDWKFNLEDTPKAIDTTYNDTDWQEVKLPHDWSIEAGYQQENTACSTGFAIGGIGWYRKTFVLSPEEKEKNIRIAFDGVYNNASVWVNGHFLGFRPNGYSSFSYDLTKHLNFEGATNVITVKVDRTAYADSRWYTGSGIYRKVQLIKTASLHIKQWGVQITTPKVSTSNAEVNILSQLENLSGELPKNLSMQYQISDAAGIVVAKKEMDVIGGIEAVKTTIPVKDPSLWSLSNPHLYKLEVKLYQDGNLVDNVTENFGIRTFDFDANTGFSLNGKQMKIKGVNLHHDAGAVGAAVPKDIWEYRMKKLRSIGVNAIRLAHNPHSVELLEVCDELGILVFDEAFDEWNLPKGKSKVYLGDNAASKEASKAYPEYFDEWAERDLKDLIKRDFNHPSVIAWSIGNEIEWTFPHYSKTRSDVNDKNYSSYDDTATYDSLTIKTAFDKNLDGKDPLVEIAHKLNGWIKEIDTSRPVTSGSVIPSVGMVSGYGDALDLYGFNYCATEYDIAHKTYPDLKIIGSENWGTYQEWKDCEDRDFVAGVFLWTGFAYLGEAGPWPRKGLNISLFDYAGFKNPRGHFFECLWKKDPKVYMVTTPAKDSEFSFDEKDGWKFAMQLTPPPVWNQLRRWEWYKVYSKWKYEANESIVVQVYTNCEEAELLLDGISLGKQKRSDFNEDNILKWSVPFKNGALKVIGYNNGKKADEYILSTDNGKVAQIAVSTTKTTIKADGEEVVILDAKLLDEKGNLITDVDTKIEFDISGPSRNLGVDNGWEKNTQSHRSNNIITHNGKAILILQSTKAVGAIYVKAKAGGIVSNTVSVVTE